MLGEGVVELSAVSSVKSVSENLITFSTVGTIKFAPSPLSITRPPKEGKLKLWQTDAFIRGF